MNKKIITLQGKGNTGKTRTLKCLIEKIKQQHEIEELYVGNENAVIITKINNKKLGVTTYGDTRKELEEKFDLMGECDFYVCASRSKGDTLKFLEEETAQGILIKHGKWYFESKDYKCDFKNIVSEINNMQTQVIYKEIIDILK